MDGLECSEILWSKIKKSNSNYRFDSHYYEKKYVLLNERLLSKPYWLLGEIVSKPIQTGHTPSMSNQSNYGGKIAFIKTDNLRTNYIKTNFNDWLSEEGNREISRTELEEKDIITTIIGATEDVIARTALVLSEHLPANINQNIVQIRVDDGVALPEYVNSYLNSIYGRDYLRYLSRQTEQVNLNCQEIASVLVPQVSMNFQNKIKDCVEKAYDMQQRAKQKFQLAHDLLRTIISVDVSSLPLTTCKSFKNSFKTSGRLDAEYFNPKYEYYEKSIKENKLGFTFVKDKFNLISNKCDRTLPQYQYVEIGDINVGTGVASPNVVLTEELPDNAKILTKTNDVLVSTVRPNRGAVAILDKDDLLVSGAFTVLREKSDYPKEVLQVLLRLEMYRDWMLRYNVGTSYPVIKDNDILNLPIPVLDKNTQKTIVENVRKSFVLREKSKILLELAIKTVEKAIETDETSALLWLESQK